MFRTYRHVFKAKIFDLGLDVVLGLAAHDLGFVPCRLVNVINFLPYFVAHRTQHCLIYRQPWRLQGIKQIGRYRSLSRGRSQLVPSVLRWSLCGFMNFSSDMMKVCALFKLCSLDALVLSFCS